MEEEGEGVADVFLKVGSPRERWPLAGKVKNVRRLGVAASFFFLRPFECLEAPYPPGKRTVRACGRRECVPSSRGFDFPDCNARPHVFSEITLFRSQAQEGMAGPELPDGPAPHCAGDFPQA